MVTFSSLSHVRNKTQLKMKITYHILLLFFLFSCHKESLHFPTSTSPNRVLYNGTWKVLWQEPLTADTSSGFSIAPVLFQDKVVFSAGFVTDNKLLYMRDQQTGDLIGLQINLPVIFQVT